MLNLEYLCLNNVCCWLLVFFLHVFISFVSMSGHLFSILQISPYWEFHPPWGKEQDNEQAAVWQWGGSVVAATSYSFREVCKTISHWFHHELIVKFSRKSCRVYKYLTERYTGLNQQNTSGLNVCCAVMHDDRVKAFLEPVMDFQVSWG